MSNTSSRVRALLLEKGAELVSVKQTVSQKQEFVMKNSVLCSAMSAAVTKMSVKIAKGGMYAEKEYTVGEDSEPAFIAEDIFSELSGRDSVFGSAPEKKDTAVNEGNESASSSAMMIKMKKLDEDAKKLGMTIPRASLMYTSISTELENELGTRISVGQSGYTLNYSTTFEKDGVSVSPIRVRKSFKALDAFPEFPLDCIKAKYCGLMLAKKPMERLTGSLIIAPGALYYLMLDFLFGQLFEDAVATGSSDWTDRMGMPVLPQSFSAYMDPFHEFCVFGERIRSDGTLSKPYTLIENGILKNFIVTTQSAAQLSLAPCGNDGDNLVMPAGNTPLEQMIAQTGKGVIIFAFAGGGSGGEFSGTSPEAFLIENGTIVAALDNPELCGNWRNVFTENEVDFSVERESDGEYLLPYMRIKDFSF